MYYVKKTAHSIHQNKSKCLGKLIQIVLPSLVLITILVAITLVKYCLSFASSVYISATNNVICTVFSLEDDALMDPFNVYLQTLLSQALDSNFLEALQHESG